jgi:hypothetical protein
MLEALATGVGSGLMLGLLLFVAFSFGLDARRFRTAPFVLYAVLFTAMAAAVIGYTARLKQTVGTPTGTNAPLAWWVNGDRVRWPLLQAGLVLGITPWLLAMGYVMGRQADSKEREMKALRDGAAERAAREKEQTLETPPPAVHAFILDRMRERNNAMRPKPLAGFRAWLLFPPVDAGYKEMPYTSVYQFSECDVVSKTCGGYFCKGWSYEGERVGAVWTDDFDPNPIRGVGRTVPVVVYWFAFAPDESACVIVETDTEQRRRSGAYALAEGAKSVRLGAVMGEVEEVLLMKPQGLPAGWRARAAEGGLEEAARSDSGESG